MVFDWYGNIEWGENEVNINVSLFLFNGNVIMKSNHIESYNNAVWLSDNQVFKACDQMFDP